MLNIFNKKLNGVLTVSALLCSIVPSEGLEVKGVDELRSIGVHGGSITIRQPKMYAFDISEMLEGSNHPAESDGSMRLRKPEPEPLPDPEPQGHTSGTPFSLEEYCKINPESCDAITQNLSEKISISDTSDPTPDQPGSGWQ